ncbi:MAG: family 43 glycosylhydrolase [Acidobacteria bacterium]|nr:family 43 glycosylhydrolase [Acidobacteriota bacterium]
MTAPFTRRTLLGGALASAWAQSAGSAAPYRTPYKYGKLVLSASHEEGAFDSRSVDCPFVFHHRGRFYMTYVGFDGTGYQTGLASSADLTAWKKEGCILRRDPASPITRYNIAMNWILRRNELRSPGELKPVGGRFLGVYHAYPNAGYEQGPAVIGLCRSRDLMHWEIDEPCLHPDENAPWEAGGLYKPCLVEDGGTYYLFYNAKTRTRPRSEGGGWIEQTGVATSTDLKTWRRHPGNPIIPAGGPGSWDERFASDPCVLKDGRRWVFFYYSLDRKGKARDLLALGDGPFTPVKVPEILIDVGAPGSVDETYAHKPSVVWRDGALYHFYCAVSGRYPNEVRGISVARSRAW